MRRLIYGVGERNDGHFTTSVNGKTTRIHSMWNHMLQRCYCPISLAKRPSYAGCTVSKEFLKFQEFADWAWKQDGFHMGWAIDKDILKKGNTIYAPEFCVFVPGEVNSLLVQLKGRRGDYPIGVNRQGNRYYAYISICNTRKRIGSYDTPEQAFFAYKEAKELHIKAVAEKYKAAIDPRAYAALMAYQVEITD